MIRIDHFVLIAVNRHSVKVWVSTLTPKQPSAVSREAFSRAHMLINTIDAEAETVPQAGSSSYAAKRLKSGSELKDFSAW